MNSYVTGKGVAAVHKVLSKKPLMLKNVSESQTKAGNQRKFKRGCYIFCRDAPPIPTAIILDESGAN